MRRFRHRRPCHTGHLPRRRILPRRHAAPLPRRHVRLPPRPLLIRMLGPVPCRPILPIGHHLGGFKCYYCHRRDRVSMPGRSVRDFGDGGCLVLGSLRSGLLLSRVFFECSRAGVRVRDRFLRRGVREPDKCNRRVVRYRGRRRVDSEWSGGMLFGGRWRWGGNSDASLGDVYRGDVPRQHSRVEWDGGGILVALGGKRRVAQASVRGCRRCTDSVAYDCTGASTTRRPYDSFP